MTSTAGADTVLRMFDDLEAVAGQGPAALCAGLEALHRMIGLLPGERAPAGARVLVLGAGGGLELRALAEMHPGWQFVCGDPAPEMRRLAERILGPLTERVELVEGTIDAAPEGRSTPQPVSLPYISLTPPSADGRWRRSTAAWHRARPSSRRPAASRKTSRLGRGGSVAIKRSRFPRAPSPSMRAWPAGVRRQRCDARPDGSGDPGRRRLRRCRWAAPQMPRGQRP